jgi:hypothetical protein
MWQVRYEQPDARVDMQLLLRADLAARVMALVDREIVGGQAVPAFALDDPRQHEQSAIALTAAGPRPETAPVLPQAAALARAEAHRTDEDWEREILESLRAGRATKADLAVMIPGVTDSVLGRILRQLAAAGVIVRQERARVGEHHVYSLPEPASSRDQEQS